jgi:hypothetical protein
VTIYLGVVPGSVLQYAQDSAQQLVRQYAQPTLLIPKQVQGSPQ